MNLSPVYLRWQEETLQKGRQEGRLEGQRLMVESLLEERFGALDEELSRIIESVLRLNPTERSQAILQLSREELLDRFGYASQREDLLQEGRQEERRQMVESALRVRFGSIDEALSGAIRQRRVLRIAPMLQLPTEELTRLLLTLSCEELLQRFGGQSI